MPKNPGKRYLATTGLDYVSTDGAEVRVEIGEEVLGLSKSAVESEIAAGNIIETNESAGEKK